MKIIGYGRQSLDDDDRQAVLDVLNGDYLTQGLVVPQFEEALAQYVGVKHAVAVSSGTAALHLAVLAGGIKPGDRGITSTLSFVASANAFYYCDATAGLVDIDARDLNISLNGIEEAVHENPDVRAVIPVHFGGLATDTGAIRRVMGADRLIIEDACHSLGGAYADGQKVGCCSDSDMTVFSFHPVKPITTGEGGAITTNDPELYESLLRLRSHGIERERDRLLDKSCGAQPWYYEQQSLGFNYRMTDIQAALGVSQLSKLDGFCSRRREIAKTYDEAFGDVEHIRPVQAEACQRERSGHHLYILHCDFPALGMTREEAMAALVKHGIGTQVHYIPIHRQPYHRERESCLLSNFPVAEEHYQKSLSIPFYPGMGNDDVERVISAVRTVFRIT